MVAPGVAVVGGLSVALAENVAKISLWQSIVEKPVICGI